ncbi:MAG TPA: hypothetical protein VK427_15260 [Kofleriaceae bacterium]|nr:hypothetical protein [Kofleriaceae bacterium]
MDPRLKGAIGTARIQHQAGELVRLSLSALEDLERLDESLYERFVATRATLADPASSEASLRKLWNDTFGGLAPLLAYCRTLEGKVEEPVLPLEEEAFDFGDLEGLDGPTTAELQLGASDIGSLLDGIDEHQAGDEDRWSTVVEKVTSIEYGLRTQIADARARLEISIAAGEANHVLELLDDAQSSACEGVHAVIAAVYEAFVPSVDPATVVPGYLTSLGRALLVRRGLAQLATTLGPNNDVLQSAEKDRHAQVIATIRDVMLHFVGSVVCRAMRAGDRWQMVEFQQQLATEPMVPARLTAEGLVKYLDSLRSINQREVLMIHDQRALEHMRDALANARQLLDISPKVAQEMLDRAHSEAQRLRGRNPVTDQLLLHLERYAPRMPPPQLLEHLENVLMQAG